jgi:hypothetical protein
MQRKTLAALVGIAALTLAGCDKGGDPASSPTASAAATPTATASESPSPSPDASPSPAPSSTAEPNPCTDPSVSAVGLPAIDFDRYQFFCIGMSFDEASATADWLTVTGDAACPWYSTVGEMSDYGFHVGAMTRPDAPGADIYLFRMTWEGTPADVAAFDPPATAANISVGSTIAEVTAAYPDAAAVVVDDLVRGPRNHLLVTGPSGGTYDFDVTDGSVTDMYWGMSIPQGVNGELCAL